MGIAPFSLELKSTHPHDGASRDRSPSADEYRKERSRSAFGYAAGVGVVPEKDLIGFSFRGISINNSSLNALPKTPSY